MFQIGESFHRVSVLDGHGILVYTLVHSVIADNLRAIQTSSIWRERDFDIHLQRLRIVPCVRTGMNG